MRQLRLIAIVSSLFILNACAPYYVKHKRFVSFIEQEQFKQAETELATSKQAKKKRMRLLYLLERGYVDLSLGNFKESADYFEEADYLIEDYRRNLGYEALAIITNPGVKPYKAEDFEIVMLHYFNAMNYLKMRNFEDALVECRRMNLSLIAMAERQKDKPKYKEDAFAHLLMGLAYEGSGDLNNAFIAYRNAYEVYKGDYSNFFEMAIPEQLKKDLIRTAAANGFQNEVEFYKKTFGYQSNDILPKSNKTELILFWNNSLGPYKEEWSIDFTLTRVGDQFVFMNPGLALSFSFPVNSVSQQDAVNLSSLSVYRIAFPRYVHRPLAYTSASVRVREKTYPLEIAENIDAIAFKSLNDRFAREMGAALLRFAVKKAAEMALRKENKDAGFLLGLANAISEQADTRNWQTLPNNISYARIPLEPGKNQILFNAHSKLTGKMRCDTIRIDAKKGRTYFEMMNTIKN